MDPTADDLLARLRRNPDDMEALATLRAHHRQRGDYEGLAKLLEGWAARSRDRSAASDALREAADVVASLLSDRDRAVSLLTRSLERDPRNEEAAEMAERMLSEAGDYQRLVEVLERRATALGAAKIDPLQTAALHHRLGELWKERLDRVDRAVFHYRKAFELDATLLEAIYAARQIYLSAGNLKAAATLYDLEANAETEVPRKVALLRELAQLRSEELGDVEGAVVALKRALVSAPEDLAVKHELASALMSRATQRGGTPGAEDDLRIAAEMFFTLAQSIPEHVIPYCEATLDAMPGHEEAMDLLEQVAQQEGRMDVLPARWVGFLTAAPDAPRADWRRERLGHAYVAAGQIEDAIACFEPLLQRGNVKAAEELIGMYQQVGRDADVPEALAMVIDHLPAEQRVPRLQELVQVLMDQGRHQEAVVRARQILEITPEDDEALELVDNHCRAHDDFEGLRALLLTTAQAPSLPRAKRKARMLEVAHLSEEELRDPQGALDAWREVVQLDRTDRDAQAARLRLLEQARRWDDVAWALEGWLEVETDPDTRAELLRRLAEVQQSKRGDAYAAIDALRSLRELRPDDDWARDGLCELLLQVDRALDAIPVLRECVERTADVEEQARLLRILATVLEERAGDDEGASRAWERLLDLAPDDADALDRLEAIDVRNQRFDRLLETLGHRVEVTPTDDRPPLLRRMAEIAFQRLGDLDRAATFYEQALVLAPEDDVTAAALAGVFERAARWDDLVALLRTRADRSEETRVRADFHRKIAHVLAERVGDEDGAADSWRETLAAGEDEEALRALRQHADRARNEEELADWLGRLAEIVPTLAEKRELLMERAELLVDVLARPEEAASDLKKVVTEIAPGDVPALVRLAEVSETIGDDRGLADALQRHLEVADEAADRVSLATRLARLYDDVLHDSEHSLEAYASWAGAAPWDETPRQRLAELLEQAERWDGLVPVLDELAELESDPDLVSELERRAANVAVHQLGDVEGGWQRLAPLVERGDALAEEALRELALATGRAEPLADLFVRMAKAAEQDADEQRRRWMDASKIFEEHVSDAQRALEAMLRAFATDIEDEGMLEQVDRLAGAAGAWLRLAQVYETLIRKREAADDKMRLLLRHAELLEGEGQDPSAALDRVMRASMLDPLDDAILNRAEDLARRTERAEELLVLYDRRRATAPDAMTVLEALLRAVRLCESDIDDHDRAEQYLMQAVHTSMGDAGLLDFLEEEVRELDEARGDEVLRRRLVSAYRQVANARGAPGSPLLERGAELLQDELGDEAEAYRVLKEATELAPGNEAALDAFERLTRKADKLIDLDAHLAKLVDEALDSHTAATILDRRGRLLEELGRHKDAAEVYRQLLPIAPEGSNVSERLRACLRSSKAFQDVLLVLDRELGRERDPARRTELLKEVARTWENDLQNRWEALDAWKRALSAAPDDAEAREAVERLDRPHRLSDDESLFAEEPKERAPAEAEAASKEEEPDAEAAPEEPDTEAASEEPAPEDPVADAAPEEPAPEEPDANKSKSRKKKRSKSKRGSKKKSGNDAEAEAGAAAPESPTQEQTVVIDDIGDLDVVEEQDAAPRSIPPPLPGKSDP